MEESKNVCPGCGRHCDLSEPHCERGRKYAESGTMPERSCNSEGREHSHGHDHEHSHEHGHHGPEGHRLSRPPFGGGSVTEADFYAGLDIESKILALLRELGRLGHSGPEGKGGQGRILHIEAGAEKETKHDSHADERSLLSALDVAERETLLALLEKLSTSITKSREIPGENDK